jgi:protoporphyrinogen/coproporphyrinogen III oxidase
LVVGGGLTGLAAAWSLGRAGVPTLLVEASNRLGGKVHTQRVDGFLVEHGPDSFISYRPAALELCRELGLGDSIIRPREPRTVLIRTRGKFVMMPEGMGPILPTRLRPFLTTRLLSPAQKLRAALDLVLPRSGEAGDVSIGSFLRRRLGRATVDRLAGPLLGGIYGRPIDELSLDAVAPQLRESERVHRSLMLGSIAAGRARKPGIGGSPFITLASGTGQLIDTLTESIGRMPCVSVRMGTRVASLERTGVRTSVRLGSGERLAPEAIVLASPAPVTAGLLESIAPQASAHLDAIPHGSTGVVSLGYREDQFSAPVEGHGFLVGDDEPLSISAGTLSSKKWAGRAPEGMVLVRTFVGSAAERLLSGAEEDMAMAAHRDIVTTMGVRGAPLIVRVARWPGVMPHYTVGHLGRVAAALAALEPYPGLVLAGAAYRGVGMSDCVAQGRAAAAAIIEWQTPRA